MAKRAGRILVASLVTLMVGAMLVSGCGGGSTDDGGGSSGTSNVTFGGATDGSGAPITSGGTTSNRVMTITGTITAAAGTTIVTASIWVNGEKRADLALTVAGNLYSYTSSIELMSGLNVIVVKNTDSAGGNHQSSDFTVTCTQAPVAVHVQLAWNTEGTDVDLHLLKPGGAAFESDPATDSVDCGYSNMTPDWNGNGIRNVRDGSAFADAQDPVLDVDDVDGNGPENIVISTPVSGTYGVGIYFYSDHGYTAPTTPVVKIWVNGQLVATYTKAAALTEYGWWKPANIVVSGSTITVTAVEP